MPRGKKRKTKKFLKYYGPEYVEKFEKEKRKKEDVSRGQEEPI